METQEAKFGWVLKAKAELSKVGKKLDIHHGSECIPQAETVGIKQMSIIFANKETFLVY